MIRILGPLACEPYLHDALYYGIQYLSYDGVRYRACVATDDAQDAHAVANALQVLQETVPLGWVGDYTILLPRRTLTVLDARGVPAVNLDGERFDGWIALSGHTINLIDILAHELAHEIEERFVGAEQGTLLRMAGYPPGNPLGEWHEHPHEMATEVICAALWGQPMAPSMLEAFGAPQNLPTIRDWLRDRIGDQPHNPSMVTDGYRVELTVGSNVARVNGTEQTLDVAPVLRSGRCFVPMRFLGEAVGATVEWNDVSKRAIYRRGETVVAVEPGSTLVWVNGQPAYIDVAPFIESSRTMVPLRWVAEAMGFGVVWDGTTQGITITK